ncbi:hypothetical protein, partial [Nocardia cyriacigeorgica]|uniref:hypothetical protein n=1 Tax=Nocardia cyriacigeorgica TaxID=135487 RepID=UPI001895AE4E
PLLLRVVGNRLMIRPIWSLGRLLTRLRDDDRLLAELTDGRHDVRARIAESYLTIGPATQRFLV